MQDCCCISGATRLPRSSRVRLQIPIRAVAEPFKAEETSHGHAASRYGIAWQGGPHGAVIAFAGRFGGQFGFSPRTSHGRRMDRRRAATIRTQNTGAAERAADASQSQARAASLHHCDRRHKEKARWSIRAQVKSKALGRQLTNATPRIAETAGCVGTLLLVRQSTLPARA